jgi:hypothetical protein
MMAKVHPRDDTLSSSVARLPDGTIVMAKDKSIGETIGALRAAGMSTDEVSAVLRSETGKPHGQR